MSTRDVAARQIFRALSPAGGRGRLVVLTYHRIPESPDALLPGEPDRHTFEQQVAMLARFCQVIPLPQAVEQLVRGDLPERAVSITFDDGYRNNHDCAAPILRRYGLNATFFVTKNAVQDGIMWNDLVIEAVRRAGSAIDLSGIGLSADPVARNADPKSLIDAALSHIKYLPLHERFQAAKDLYDSISSTAAPRLMMTEAEVVALARQGFDVGGHTVTHPILTTLTPDLAQQEIDQSASWLQGLTGTAPVSFAYPNGRPGRDYSSDHIAMVRNAGFRVAVSTVWACATRRSDVLQIPRVGLSGASGGFTQLLKLYISSYR